MFQLLLNIFKEKLPEPIVETEQEVLKESNLTIIPTLEDGEHLFKYINNKNKSNEIIYVVYRLDYTFEHIMKVFEYVACDELALGGELLFDEYVIFEKSFQYIKDSKYLPLKVMVCYELINKGGLFEMFVEKLNTDIYHKDSFKIFYIKSLIERTFGKTPKDLNEFHLYWQAIKKFNNDENESFKKAGKTK